MSCTTCRKLVKRAGTSAWGSGFLVALALVGGIAGAADDQVLEGAQPERGVTGAEVVVGGNAQVVINGQVLLNLNGGRFPNIPNKGGVGIAPQQAFGLGVARLFDQQAFPHAGAAVQRVVIVNGVVTTPQTVVPHERAIAGMRLRGAARIAILEQVCRLNAGQMQRLQMALESDVKRIGSAIESMRQQYVDMPWPPRQEPLTQDIVTALRADAARCRQLIEGTPGSDSLLGTVIQDVLSPEQTRAFETWLEGRRACRWRAMVATVLVQLDESGLGLTSAQAAAIERSLMAEMPKLEVLRDIGTSTMDGRLAHFGRIIVLRQLGLVKPVWQKVCDPRQQALLEAHCANPLGDPASVEHMLVEQGILERDDGDASPVKETN